MVKKKVLNLQWRFLKKELKDLTLSESILKELANLLYNEVYKVVDEIVKKEGLEQEYTTLLTNYALYIIVKTL